MLENIPCIGYNQSRDDSDQSVPEGRVVGIIRISRRISHTGRPEGPSVKITFVEQESLFRLILVMTIV